MGIRERRVAVLGAGSWGTAFAKVLADAGREVTLWARRREVAEAIRDRPAQPRLPARACGCPTGSPRPRDAAEALDGADLVVLAVPSQTLRGNLGRLGRPRSAPTPRWSA